MSAETERLLRVRHLVDDDAGAQSEKAVAGALELQLLTCLFLICDF